MNLATPPKQPPHKERLSTSKQESAYSSPWDTRTRLLMATWSLTYLLLFRWTPKPFYGFRSILLRIFGATTEGITFVASSAQISMPWNLTMKERACIGAGASIYNLARVTIGARATVAQEAYLCAGTHDFNAANLPLVTGPIEIGPDCFIGARAFINPGINVGEGAIVGACSVVTRDVPAWTVSAGNPARVINERNRPPHRPTPRTNNHADPH